MMTPSLPIQGIIFDMDGTLLDTLTDIAHSVNAMLTEYGFSAHPLDNYREFVGDGLRMLVTRALPEKARSDAALVDRCVHRAHECYGANWNRETRLYDGIAALLDAVDPAPLFKAILSNKPHDLAVRYADHYLDRWHFDVVMGKKDPFPVKPDPTSARYIAQRLNLPPAAFFFVGDGMTDFNTAIAAGMRPVGVSWGFKGERPLVEGGCSRLIHHPMELVNILRENGVSIPFFSDASQ